MRTPTILAAVLVMPLLLACNRSEDAQSAADAGPEKQAAAPSSPDRMLESAPPAAGTSPYSVPPPSPAGDPSTPSAADSQTNPQSEPAKGK